jgi:small-conductance mechanosensitive channel
MFFDQIFYHHTMKQWTIALAIFVLSFLVLWLIRGYVRFRLRRFARKTKTFFDDMIADLLSRIRFFFLIMVSLYLASLVLELPPLISTILTKLVFVTVALQVAIWANSSISFWINHYKQQNLKVDAASVTTFATLGFVGRIILWSVVVLLIVENLGLDITAVVAGVGISGVAIALAVQNILGDLLASFSIVFDKPFVIGDFITVDKHMGTVENIGLKTTRIRSLSGEELIFSNADLLKSRISNFKRMTERRVIFTIAVTYQTDPGKVEKIPFLIKEIVQTQKNIRFDRVHLKELGSSALIFEIVYWTLTPDYDLFMDIHHDINLQILKRFQKEQIEFAYPSQTVYLSRPD